MATVFKPTRPYPLPPNHELSDRDGRPHVRIGDGKRAAYYPVTKDRRKYLTPSSPSNDPDERGLLGYSYAARPLYLIASSNDHG